MYAILYIFSAFTLVRYVFSVSYRAKTNERWKKTPRHRVVYEVGAGIIGLIVLTVAIYFVLNLNRDSRLNEDGPVAFLIHRSAA
jgi:hypothetical protein